MYTLPNANESVRTYHVMPHQTQGCGDWRSGGEAPTGDWRVSAEDEAPHVHTGEHPRPAAGESGQGRGTRRLTDW